MTDLEKFDWASEKQADGSFEGYVMGPVRTAKDGEEMKAKLDKDIALYTAAYEMLSLAEFAVKQVDYLNKALGEGITAVSYNTLVNILEVIGMRARVIIAKTKGGDPNPAS